MRLAALLLVLATRCAAMPALSDERLVLQTTLGDIELAFYPEVAPVTVKHIIELGRLGAYNTNHFFRVDKGFVAQARRSGTAKRARVCLAGEADASRRAPAARNAGG